MSNKKADVKNLKKLIKENSSQERIGKLKYGVENPEKLCDIAKKLLDEKVNVDGIDYRAELADLYINMAMRSNFFDKYKLEKEYELKAKDLYEELASENVELYKEKLAKVYNNLAVTSEAAKSYDEAENFFQKSFEIQKTLKDDKRGLAMLYMNIGQLRVDTKKYEEAEEYFLKAIEIRKELNITCEDYGNPLNTLDKRLEDAQFFKDF